MPPLWFLVARNRREKLRPNRQAQDSLARNKADVAAAQAALDDLRRQQLSPQAAQEGVKRAVDGQTSPLALAFEQVRKYLSTEPAALAKYDLLAKEHGAVSQVLAIPDGNYVDGSGQGIGASADDQQPPTKKLK